MPLIKSGGGKPFANSKIEQLFLVSVGPTNGIKTDNRVFLVKSLYARQKGVYASAELIQLTRFS